MTSAILYVLLGENFVVLDQLKLAGAVCCRSVDLIVIGPARGELIKPRM